MPACTSENLNKLWGSGEDVARPGNGSTSGSSMHSNSPSPPNSPTKIRKFNGHYRRSNSNLSKSEPFVIHSDRRDSLAKFPNAPTLSRPLTPSADQNSFWVHIIGWYPLLLLRILRALIVTLSEITIGRVLLAVPAFWATVWLHLFWKFAQIPLTLLKCVLTLVHTPIKDRFKKKKIVLISGGSTIQALHLARNFYLIGAKVIVCEIEGLSNFTQFSTAVSKFYTLPKPNGEHPQEYVRALCNIVDQEEITYYVPVCASSSAVYDALAKPHLELMGCTCFCPGVKESWILDDVQEMFRRCENAGIPVPEYHEITSTEDVYDLYENDKLRHGYRIMSSVGHNGLRERSKVTLPLSWRDFKISHEINTDKPWIAVHEVTGEMYVTCTTIKNSYVVANVTCSVDKETKAYIPVQQNKIADWLNNFFSKLCSLRPIDGHVYFRFVKSDLDGVIYPVDSGLGISMPYICHTSAHPRLLWKPTHNFIRQSSGPIMVDSRQRWISDTAPKNIPNGITETNDSFIGTALDKRETLFVYWDPLPYFSYYHMQLPLKNVLGFVQGRGQDHFARTLAAPVH